MPRMSTVPLLLLLLLLLSPAATVRAADVTFSGDVSYSGAEVADSIYVVAFIEATDVLLAINRIAVTPPPYSRPFSLTFDNTGLGPESVALFALIDVDASGFDWDIGAPAGDVQTNGDVVGWYDGQQDPVFLTPSTSQPNLDFAMPTGEIHGNVILIGGQTNVFILATSQVGGDVPGEAEAMVSATGPYRVVGVYPGDWIVQGISDQGDVCFGDATCASPTIVTLALGEVRTGIDIDFTPLPVEANSWGSVKSLYR